MAVHCLFASIKIFGSSRLKNRKSMQTRFSCQYLMINQYKHSRCIAVIPYPDTEFEINYWRKLFKALYTQINKNGHNIRTKKFSYKIYFIQSLNTLLKRFVHLFCRVLKASFQLSLESLRCPSVQYFRHERVPEQIHRRLLN